MILPLIIPIKCSRPLRNSLGYISDTLLTLLWRDFGIHSSQPKANITNRALQLLSSQVRLANRRRYVKTVSEEEGNVYSEIRLIMTLLTLKESKVTKHALF